MNKLLLTILCATLMTASAAAQWRLVWSDEFNGPAGSPPAAQNWAFESGNGNGWGNNEKEYYCAPGVAGQQYCDLAKPNLAMDGNGNLVIQARVEPSGKWTSGRMKSKGLAEFTYGRIEARMRLPNNCVWNGGQCTGLQGIWPAFWMMGSNGVEWPGNGELDIMENIGKQPATVHSTLHGTGYNAGYGKPYRSTDGLPFGNAFHVYGMIWSPLEVRFYVDDPNNIFADFTADMIQGKNGASSSHGRWEFWGHPFYLLFNLAVGGIWPGDPDDTTASPQNLIIDWVRVYQWAQPAAPVLLTAQPVSGNQVQLTWKASASTASNITYTVFRSAQRGGTHALENMVASQISATAFADVPPQPGATYYYVVTASGPDTPESAMSNELSVTTPAERIGVK